VPWEQLEEKVAYGADYLDLVTRLLQRVRLADPWAGLWEAADLQWWWRRDRPSDREGQLFWLDGRNDPVAAVILTDWGRTWACDVITVPDGASTVFPTVWPRAMERMDALVAASVEVAAGDGNALMLEALATAGFMPTGEAGATSWLEAALRPQITRLASGFRLTSRAGAGARPHHLTGSRNGDRVAERLAQCSLYAPDLDLSIVAPNGDVAAYAMFWPDPITGVGLVEPLGTDSRYRRLGLARHLLTSGLDRLAARGCHWLKVSFETENSAARALYVGAGFATESTGRIYRRQPV
jgi:ribosomal protein S18 acetylase RimI-like enzyme